MFDLRYVQCSFMQCFMAQADPIQQIQGIEEYLVSDIDSTTWLAKRKHSNDGGAAVGRHALVMFTGTAYFKCDACHKKFIKHVTKPPRRHVNGSTTARETHTA